MSPPSKKIKVDLGLGGELYELRKSGRLVDVYFSVPPSSLGEEPIKVPAHKIILIATSSIFDTMMTQRWIPGDVVNVPEKISVKAVELFVKVSGFYFYFVILFINLLILFYYYFQYLYLKQLDDGIEIDLMLDVMLLADHYEVEKLFEICDQHLVKEVDPENCVLIYQHTRLFEATQIKMMAFDCIIE
jgi:hypothetical protein